MVSYGILLQAAYETVRISLPTLSDAVLSRTNYARCDVRLDSWSRRLVEQAKIDIETHGLSNLDRMRSYVVMSNHQSHYDIPIIFQALKIPIRMVAKTELFRIPIMGPAMLKSGFVEIDRKNGRRAIEQMEVAKQRIREDGLSIWIAPEGTRSTDGRLGPFKSGGFHLAFATGAPILPVTIDGSIDVHRAGEGAVHRGQTVHVTVHPPILPADYGRRRLQDLSLAVRRAIESALPERYRSTDASVSEAPNMVPEQSPNDTERSSSTELNE